MAALDFPSSPTNGQVYGQYVYDSTKGAWRVSADLLASATPSPTAPTNPVSGDLWFNTNDGVMFMYFNDGNSSQWVEVKSNTASGSTVAARIDALEAKPNGLVALVPSSITLGSGTGSVDATGIATFTNASTVTINNCFTSAYVDYKIVISAVMTTANQDIWFRWSNSGTDVATGYYGASIYAAYNASPPGSYGNMNNANAAPIGNFGVLPNNAELLASPRNTYSSIKNQAYSPALAYYVSGGYNGTTATSPNGFKVYSGGAGNLTGTIRVYGMR